MSLKTKVILILTGLLLLYGLIDFSVQRYIILPRFQELETAQAQDNLQRAIHAIQREIEHLDVQCHDWSAWDDTYRFAEHPTDVYIESNLSFSTFKDNKINLLYLCNRKGTVLWGKIFDLKTQKELKARAFPGDALPPDHPFLQFDPGRRDMADASLNGVIVTELGPMLVASRPILMSGGRGTMHGTFIMGTLLTRDFVARLADQTRVNMIISGDTFGIGEALVNAPYTWGKDNPYAIRFLSGEKLETITAYPDMQGAPAFVIKTVLDRDIMVRGHETMQFALLTILVAGFLIVIIILIMMEKVILSPISNLMTHMLAIRRSGNLRARHVVTRNDEIGTLATEFNILFGTIDMMKTELENTNDELKRDIAIRQEIEDKLHEANRKLVMLATMDGLTQVSNRRRFDDVLKLEWKRGVRDSTPLSLIIFDVDSFKLYNDTYGHQAGDDCLKAVATAIQTKARRVADVAARYGGEEFALILPNTDITGAAAVAERIRAYVYSLALPHEKADTHSRVTLSAGVACLVPSRENEMETLIAMADKALYEAKAGGRNLVKTAVEQ